MTRQSNLPPKKGDYMTFAIGVLLGALGGILLMCLMIISKQGDD